MFTPRDIVWGIVVPALIAALAMALAWRPWRRQASRTNGFWGASVALTAGFATAFLGIRPGSPLPPREAVDWLFLMAAAGLVLGLIDGLCVIEKWIRPIVACACLAPFVWLLLPPLHPESMSTVTKTAWAIGLLIPAVAWWMWLDAFAVSHTGPLVPFLLGIVSSAVALVLMMSGSKLLGQLGGVVAATMGSCFAVAILANSVSLARGGVFIAVSMIAGLLICAHFYAYLTRLNGSLLLIAGVATAAGSFLPADVLQGWKRPALLLLLVLIPAGAAVALAALEFAASATDPGYSY
jgi:hypothetical protein